MIQAMRIIASEKFKFKDLSFNGFDKVDTTEIMGTEEEDDEEFDSQVDVWAKFSLSFDGIPPDSYRVLNTMLMDYVDDNITKIKTLVNQQLVPYLKEQYKDIDLSDLTDDFGDYIWEDQVDYMPEVDEENGLITFVVEMVLDVETEEITI